MGSEYEKQNFKEQNMIKDEKDDMEGIKITDDNVDEIVDDILDNVQPLSPEYIKMFSDI